MDIYQKQLKKKNIRYINNRFKRKSKTIIMNTGLIIYILVCVGIAIGRLRTVNYAFPIWNMIRFIILAPITIPIFIGSIITIVAEYIRQHINDIDDN